jgi:hypothetical protein
MAEPGKLYLFADETLSVSSPAFLLVAIAAVESGYLEEVKGQVQQLEADSGRTGRKWSRSLERRKIVFLEGLEGLLSRLPPICWRAYDELARRPVGANSRNATPKSHRLRTDRGR